MARRIKRDVINPNNETEVIWHTLKYGPLNETLVIHKRAMDNGPPGERHYIEYLVSNKHEDCINWNTEDYVKLEEEFNEGISVQSTN